MSFFFVGFLCAASERTLMKKFIIYLLKPFSFLPALLVMYMIFSFSSQTGVDSGNLSYKISYGIVSVADRVLEKNLSEGDKEYYAGESMVSEDSGFLSSPDFSAWLLPARTNSTSPLWPAEALPKET